MKKALVFNPQCDLRTAFAAGLRRHGWTVECTDRYKRCDLLVLWGVRQRSEIQLQRAAGGEVCILERGYLGDRYAWTSVSFGGGLNGRGEFRGPVSDGSRWERHFAPTLKPWRASSDQRRALIMGQLQGDQSLRGVNIPEFYNKATNAFRAAGYSVKLRQHPGPVHRRVKGLASLADDLAGADVVVTFNSNSGVDAVLAGVPTVAVDAGSMVYGVAGHDFKTPPPTPDRAAWAHRLAWCQYQLSELESGYCWEVVGGR